MSLDELKENYQYFHISQQSIQHCEETSVLNQNIIIPHQLYYYGLINLINARDIFIKRDFLAFFIFKNVFLVVVLDDEDNHIRDIFNSISDYVLEKDVSITRLVYNFLNELVAQDHRYIEELQDEIDDLELHNSEEESLDFSNELRQLSKEVLLLRNYYDNLTVIGEELQLDYLNMFQEDDMRYFEVFTRRLERLSNGVEILRELLNQAHDSHQSKLDYHLNKTMQFFTVITTIFMPLTLMTGWYGMNFKNMPEINNPYAYFVIIGISIGIVIALIFWFKKKRYL